MLRRRRQLPTNLWRCARPWTGIAPLVVLCTLALLPVQMKAGVDQPHPHALLQLLIDASDGVINHHHTDGDEHRHAHAASCDVDGQGAPDLPSFGEILGFSGDLPLADASVALLWLPVRRSRAIWQSSGSWRASIPLLEPPPPRQTAS
ncbi:MAG: hypothetical protein IT338_16455 [Thermomicrobiales bacterium]|nr:hypothetical protein [Thermomicrobiales bacterium]